MVRLCFVFYINIIKVVSLLSFPGIDMRRQNSLLFFALFNDRMPKKSLLLSARKTSDG